MAIIRPIFLGIYSTGTGSTFLKVEQSGVTVVPTTALTKSTTANRDVAKLAFVWQGKPIFQQGRSDDGARGYYAYSHDAEKFSIIIGKLGFLIPFGKYMLRMTGTRYMRSTSLLFNDEAPTGAAGIAVYDRAALGNDLFMMSQTGDHTWIWTHPFSGAPVDKNSISLTRICSFRGSMYGLDVNAGVCFLRKYTAGAWATLGAGFTPTDSARLITNPSSNAFFESGGKLWAVLGYGNLGTDQVRCYELDHTTGGATEQDAYVPAAWKAGSVDSFQRIFEVPDDVGSSRQVFICRCGGYGGAGGWEIAEFDEGLWTIHASGAQKLYPYAGLIYDTDATGAKVVSAADSAPSSHVTASIEVNDLESNGDVDIDPRFHDLSDTGDAPPYTPCTEKAGVGSEGKTGLSSKLSGITTIADLSDDFDDGSINTDIWEPVNPSFWTNRDWGCFHTSLDVKYYVSESNSRIVLGSVSPAPTVEVGNGVGIKSRWGISGAFQVDAILAGLGNLAANVARGLTIVMYIKECTARGYLIRIFKTDGVPTIKARGLWLNEHNNVLETADSTFNPTDGTVLRISRSVGNVWSLILDPDGVNENITPIGGPNLDKDVRIWLFGHTMIASTNWVAADPAPGFSNLAVSGAGSLGKFDGVVAHAFMFDHIADLGAGFNNDCELYAGTT